MDREDEETCENKLRTYEEVVKEPANMSCGPQIEDKYSPFPLLDELSTALQTQNSHKHAQREENEPFSLQTCCPSQGSYPTHLEISVSHADAFQKNKMSILPPSMEPHQLNASRLKNSAGCLSQETRPRTSGPHHLSDPLSPFVSVPSIPVQAKGLKQTQGQENMMTDEEAVFFSFVILHSVEDMDLADELKEKLESFGTGLGATFSQDFAIAGRNTLMCIEDAIDNSAFTILLLTRNFNTRLLEVETNSALMNSINNRHKYNTVIPLLPKENCMPRERMPKLLQTLVALEDNKTFEKRAKKAIAPARIEYQRQVWVKEQMIKQQVRRKEKLRLENKLKMDLNRVSQEAYELQQEQGNPYLSLGQLHTEQSPWTPPRSNIHIQNARCIMIGNNSRMTVSLNEDCLGDNDFKD